MTIRDRLTHILADLIIGIWAITAGFAAGYIADICLDADTSHTLGAVLLVALAVWGVANVCRLHVGKVASRNAACTSNYPGEMDI